MHGLLLRNTQVKLVGEESVPGRPRNSAVSELSATCGL